MATANPTAPAEAHPLFTVTTALEHFSAASLESAIAAFERWRDETGVGASEIGARFPVHRDGAVIGHLSYNGRYWPTAEVIPLPGRLAVSRLQDARAGMAWFNSLTPSERRHWLDIADSAVPVEAWRAFQNS